LKVFCGKLRAIGLSVRSPRAGRLLRLECSCQPFASEKQRGGGPRNRGFPRVGWGCGVRIDSYCTGRLFGRSPRETAYPADASSHGLESEWDTSRQSGTHPSGRAARAAPARSRARLLMTWNRVEQVRYQTSQLGKTRERELRLGLKWTSRNGPTASAPASAAFYGRNRSSTCKIERTNADRPANASSDSASADEGAAP
jgi:hypothetical protein